MKMMKVETTADTETKRLMNSQKIEKKYVSVYPKGRFIESREKKSQNIVQKNISPRSRLVGKEPNYELLE